MFVMPHVMLSISVIFHTISAIGMKEKGEERVNAIKLVSQMMSEDKTGN